MRAMRARNMTFCTLAGRDGSTLGIRTARGILDVAGASRLFRIKAPTDIHAVIEGADCAPLVKLTERALNDKRGKSVLVPEARARFAPAVPRPGKIICVGLNYRHTRGRPVTRFRRCRSCSTNTTTRSSAIVAGSRCRRKCLRSSTTRWNWWS